MPAGFDGASGDSDRLTVQPRPLGQGRRESLTRQRLVVRIVRFDAPLSWGGRRNTRGIV